MASTHTWSPRQCKVIASARLNSDMVGAAPLADPLPSNLLPESWTAP